MSSELSISSGWVVIPNWECSFGFRAGRKDKPCPPECWAQQSKHALSAYIPVGTIRDAKGSVLPSAHLHVLTLSQGFWIMSWRKNSWKRYARSSSVGKHEITSCLNSTRWQRGLPFCFLRPVPVFLLWNLETCWSQPFEYQAFPSWLAVLSRRQRPDACLHLWKHTAQHQDMEVPHKCLLDWLTVLRSFTDF